MRRRAMLKIVESAIEGKHGNITSVILVDNGKTVSVSAEDGFGGKFSFRIYGNGYTNVFRKGDFYPCKSSDIILDYYKNIIDMSDIR